MDKINTDFYNDIFSFINSRDIRIHLRKISYPFRTDEAAWLIYQCRDVTIKEKHKAWQELIETMPDCRIEQRHNTAPQESLHVFLREYMALEDRLASAFYEDADNGRKARASKKASSSAATVRI